MNSVNVFISWDGDAIGRAVGRAVLTDQPEELARISQAIDRGNEVIKSFALSCGGRVIESGGDEVTIEVPARALADLEEVRRNYSSAVGATVSVGVGRKLSQSAKALMAAKLRGKDRTVIFDKDVEKEVAEAATKEKTEAEKIGEEYLSKDEAPHHGRTEPKAPSVDHAEHSEGAEAEKEAKVPHQDTPTPSFEHSFRAAAEGQEKRDQASLARKSADIQGLKENVADALDKIRGQLPVLGQLKNAYPDTYKSILSLVQSVIGLGRELDASDKALAKAARPLGFYKEEIQVGVPNMESRFDDYGLDDLRMSDMLPGGLADDKSPEDFDPDALALGIQHEMEHTNDPELAREIAMDHLTEDPHYYDNVGGDKGLEKAVSSIPMGSPKKKPLRQSGDYEPSVPAKTDFHNVYDYSHVLPEKEKAQGLTLEVHHYGWTLPGDERHPEVKKQRMAAVLRQAPRDWYERDTGGRAIGSVDGIIKKKGATKSFGAGRYPTDSIEPHSELSSRFRGRGLGLAMYEALFAHGKNGLGIGAIHGGIHSADADALHRRLAKKHGFEYKAEPNLVEDQDTGEKNPDTEYPYGEYRYTLKSEIDGIPEEAYIGRGRGVVFEEPEIAKSVKTLPAGPEVEAPSPGLDEPVFHKAYDYSHVLPEKARQQGLKLLVHHYVNRNHEGKEKGRLQAALKGPQNQSIGEVYGFIRPKGEVDYKTGHTREQAELEPHSDLDRAYRGQGLGSAMYEALFAHAANVAGIDTVHGGMHSYKADALHKRLATKHGFDYKADYQPEKNPAFPYGEYKYTLKSELDGLPEEAYIGPGKGVVFGRSGVAKEEVEPNQKFPPKKVLDKAGLPPHATTHRKLDLPVGTTHNGEIKVRFADGKTGWKGVRAGMIQGQMADAPVMGANSHPVSSREPGSR